MESLESKLDRLSPEQRKEVEDFVEFLIFRSGIFQELPAASPVQPRIQNVSSSSYRPGTGSYPGEFPRKGM